MPVDTLDEVDVQSSSAVEVAATSPEVISGPLEMARHRFAEATCASAEEVARLRPRLHALVDRAIASTGDPQDQRTLRMYLGIKEYQLFGQPGDPLPPGYIFTGPLYNAELKFDEGACYCYNCNARAEKLVGDSDVAAIDKELEEARESRANEMREAGEAYIRTLPGYAVLRNMSVEIPDALPDPHARILKENTIRELIERKWGAKLGEATPGGLQAKQEYLKEMAKLDLEEELERSATRRGKTGQRASFRLAKDRITDSIRRAKGVGAGRQATVELTAYGRGTILKFEGDDRGELTYNLGQTVLGNSQLVENAPPLDRFATYDLYGELYQIMYSPSFNGSFEDALNLAVSKAALRLVDNELDTTPGVVMFDRRPKYHFRMPPEGRVEEDRSRQREHYDWHNQLEIARQESSTVGFVSREEIARRNRNTIGSVLTTKVDDGGPKIIQTIDAAPPANFEKEGAHEILFLSLDPEKFEGTPHIPGYRLTSAKHSTGTIIYGFEKDPAGDPYAKANMQIPEHARLELAKKYQNIGLETLADALRKVKHLSVADLAQLIQGETYYPIVQSVRRGKLPPDFTPTDLEDFKDVIRNKNLWAQCSGSGMFLALSLSYCGFEAGITEGNMVDLSRARIKEAPHRQTFLNYEGRRYILDATGTLSAKERLIALAASAGKTVADATKVFRRIGRPSKQAPPASVAPEIIPPQRPERIRLKPAQAAARKEEDLRQISNALELSLAPLFGASTREGLVRALSLREGGVRANLNRGNPIDRVISALRRAADDAISDSELAALERYLSGYTRNPGLLERRGVPKLQASVTEMLSGFVAQARLALARAGQPL